MDEQPKRRRVNIAQPTQQEPPNEPPAIIDIPPEAAVVPDSAAPEIDTDEDQTWMAKIDEAKTQVAAAQVHEEPIVPPPTVTQAQDLPKTVEELQAELAALRKEKEALTKTKTVATEEVVTPTQEDLAAKRKAIEQATAAKNNASAYLYTDLGSDADMDAAFTRAMEEDDRPESEKTANPSDYITGLALCSYLGLRNKQNRLLTRFINDLTAANKELTKCIHELRLAKVSPQIEGTGSSSGPKKLTGAAALTAVISRQHGMYRIQLYNSGFWITVRPPTLVMMDEFIRAMDGEFKELGRIIGGFYHHVSGVFLKQKVADILPQLIVSSNFAGYKDNSELIKNISYQDYETILWALCCLMYRDGVGIGVYCTNPDCKHIDTAQFIDLANACYINTDAFNAKAMEWMLGGMNKTRTAEDLQYYREKVLGFSRELEVDDGLNVYTLTVPTLHDYITMGTSLVASIAALTNGDKSIKSDAVLNQVTFHLYKMLAPWIKSLTMRDADKNTLYVTEDTAAIYESLDISKYDNSTLYDKIEEFVRDTRVSYFVLTTLHCPVCGKRTNVAKDDLFPMDVEHAFFCLSCLQLEQIGVSL